MPLCEANRSLECMGVPHCMGLHGIPRATPILASTCGTLTAVLQSA